MISGAQQLLVALHFATLESPSEWDHFDRSLYCELPDCVCVILYPYSFMVSWIQVKILLRTGPSRCRLLSPFLLLIFFLCLSASALTDQPLGVAISACGVLPGCLRRKIQSIHFPLELAGHSLEWTVTRGTNELKGGTRKSKRGGKKHGEGKEALGWQTLLPRPPQGYRRSFGASASTCVCEREGSKQRERESGKGQATARQTCTFDGVRVPLPLASGARAVFSRSTFAPSPSANPPLSALAPALGR